MSNLLILGAGGHAKVVAEVALATGYFTRIAFLDDRSYACNTVPMILGLPVLGPLSQAFEPELKSSFSAAFVAFGQASSRLSWINKLNTMGYNLPGIVHPTASVSPSAKIGSGTVVMAHSVIQAQVLIGSGVILNTRCSVDHDSQLSAGVHICPGASLAGEVKIGMRSWIGIGSSVIQQIRIGADVTVGAGAAVVRDLPDGVTAIGVPARVTKPN